MTLPKTTRCLLLAGDISAPDVSVETIPIGRIPGDGDTLIRVLFSSLNYKDALAVTGRGKIVRRSLPFVPGIDMVGQVVESTCGEVRAGDTYIATGWALGEESWGGYSQYQRVRSDQLVPIPFGMSPFVAMTAGTAGLTAMLAVMALEGGGVTAENGEVLVTGASGGVGSLSILFLSSVGYSIVASTGKLESRQLLHQLGASNVIERSRLSGGPARPLETARWSGAVDSVGGATLSAILSRVRRHGVVASCGLAGGADFGTTVYPFILRGVSLIGIDSNTCPYDRRVEAWGRVARHLKPEMAARLATTISLDDVPARSADLLAGRTVGRLVVRVAEQAT